MAGLRERLLRLDERSGVPRDEQGVREQAFRRWWSGAVLSVIWLTAVLILSVVSPHKAVTLVGTGYFVLFLAFHSGYMYANRLLRLGVESSIPVFRLPDTDDGPSDT